MYTWDWKSFPNFKAVHDEIKKKYFDLPEFHEFQTGSDDYCLFVSNGNIDKSTLVKAYTSDWDDTEIWTTINY